MSDEKKPLKLHGVVEPKGTAWLNEVRVDAARNTVELLRQQAEDREFEKAKADGITVKEIVAKGQRDLVTSDVVEVSAGKPGSVQGETDKEVKENEKAEEKAQKQEAESNSAKVVSQKGSK